MKQQKATLCPEKEPTSQILALFRGRPGMTISGAELGQLLNMSRTAVWKHVHALKELGYQIQAEPSRGYRLLATPDLLIPQEISAGLAVHRIGRQIICYREVDSTNRLAYTLAEDGAPEGTTVVADTQTHGKGRLGRTWVSPPGVNLYCSIVLRPSIQPTAASQLTFLSVVALARTIERVAGLTSRIKWPNDLLIADRKIAGLLNELSAETDRVNFLILGIGVNLNMLPEQFPPDLRQPATSLAIECGKPVHRASFARALLEELDGLYGTYLAKGYEPIRAEWLRRSAMGGRTVTVTNPGYELTGVVRGIDEYGALLVQGGNGHIEQVLAGDVKLVENNPLV